MRRWSCCLGATALVGLLVSGVGGDQEIAGPDRVLPAEACTAIVQEANKVIQEALKGRMPADHHRYRPKNVIRPNALLIALAAQNRMGNQGVEARRLATLRDAALDLAEAVKKDPPDAAAVVRLARTLQRFPDVEPD